MTQDESAGVKEMRELIEKRDDAERRCRVAANSLKKQPGEVEAAVQAFENATQAILDHYAELERERSTLEDTIKYFGEDIANGVREMSRRGRP